MPGYKGHLNGGLVIGALLVGVAVVTGYLSRDPMQLALLMGFCLLGALFPDIDTDSKGQNLFYSGLIIIDGYLIYLQHYRWAAWVGLFSMLPALGHHRGWTHTWWAMLVVPLPIVIVPYLFFNGYGLGTFKNYYMAFALGYFSHLLLDRKFTL
ncbi:MAG: metal-dependent hydrolase [Desulfobacteraceae bacterium]|jgi:membrane-bound metal-dependent hydrolase YbcI (DUF457 family)